jgi:hypothetical protein
MGKSCMTLAILLRFLRGSVPGHPYYNFHYNLNKGILEGALITQPNPGPYLFQWNYLLDDQEERTMPFRTLLLEQVPT